MADHTHLLSQRWTDILPPATPPAVNSEMVFAGVVLLLLAILVVSLLWQLRPRQSARRALRRFRRQLHSGAADTRTIAFCIYRAVLDGLSLNPMQLRQDASDTDAWADFYRRLQISVFAANPPSRKEVFDLIRDGLYWLRHAGAH